MGLTIGVDVGGTKIAAGAVDDQGKILEKLRRPTPSASPTRTARVIAETVTALLARHEARAVGVGAAGFVDETRSTVSFAPNLAWRDEPLREKIEALVGLPVVVENDANASAWAEARFGAACGQGHVLFIAVGTGIGAGFVLADQLYRGRWGMAGEPGHFRVVPEGRLCGCGNRGCWEQYASGNALVAEARDIARRSPSAAIRLLQLAGGSPEGIGGHEVTIAAREGDPAALRCFGIVGSWLGQGLADLAAILDPGCFVIGGGVSEAGDLLIGPARAAYDKGLTGARYRPRADVRLAALGADAGIVGAADLARAGPRALPGRRSPAGVPGRVRRPVFPRCVRQRVFPAPHTTAPSSGPESVGGRSCMRTTRVAKPPTNAATAQNAATLGTSQPISTANSR
jgi:glucokinase